MKVTFLIVVAMAIACGDMSNQSQEETPVAIEPEITPAEEDKAAPAGQYGEPVTEKEVQARSKGWKNEMKKGFGLTSHTAKVGWEQRAVALTPDKGLVVRLDQASDGMDKFRPFLDISLDGQFAVVGFAAENHPDLNHVHVLAYTDSGKWKLINELKGLYTPPELTAIKILIVVDGKIYFLAGGNTVYTFDSKSSTWVLPEDDSAIDELGNTNFASDDHRVNLMLKDHISRKHDIPWAKPLVDLHYPGAEIQLRTSMNNRILMGLSIGKVLSIQACEYGSEHILEDESLVCVPCPETNEADLNCQNPLQNIQQTKEPVETRRKLYDDLRTAWEARQDVDWFDPNSKNPLAGKKLMDQRSEGQEREGFYLGGIQGPASPKMLWNATQNAYKGRKIKGNWKVWRVCQKDNATAKFMYIDGANPIMVVAISGTDGFKELGDWGDNMDIRLRTTNGITNHRGFYRHQEKIEPCLNNYIQQLNQDRTGLDYIVGHSLGGAAATVYAQHNDQTGRYGLYTFGAPATRGPEKVMKKGKNKTVRPSCSVKGVRYAHIRDPVPSNFLSMLKNFKHDVKTSKKVYTKTYCQKRVLGVCLPWKWVKTKKVASQNCATKSGGCGNIVSCLYNFLTIHDDYGAFLD